MPCTALSDVTILCVFDDPSAEREAASSSAEREAASSLTLFKLLDQFLMGCVLGASEVFIFVSFLILWYS